MKLLTRETLAQEVPAKHKATYGDGQYPKWVPHCEALQKLTPPINPDDVDAILGMTSWTTPPKCSECHGEFKAVMQMGAEPDYESETAYLCLNCLEMGLKQLKEPS